MTPQADMAAAAGIIKKVKKLNEWREQYNPLRNLTIARAISLLEAWQRGWYADPQWACFFVEQTDADLVALLERRLSAIVELEKRIKISEDAVADDPSLESLADEQADALGKSYERMTNFYELVEHMALASFRGFSVAGVEADHFILPDHWNIVRDGMRGDFYWNPEARQTGFESLGADNRLPPEGIIMREVKRPINRIALIKYIRANLSEKDWDGFIEIYGIPGGVIIEPPNVPAADRETWRDQAGYLAEGGTGSLPNGSQFIPHHPPAGESPFRPRLEWLREQLVIAGTGGLLTMLAMPQGIGSGSSDAHEATFRAIARREARQISETLQRQFDARILAALFPGRPILAYFELAANEQPDTGEFLEHLVKLGSAGYRVKLEQVAEITGYDVELAPTPAAAPAFPGLAQNTDRTLNATATGGGPDSILNFDPSQPRDESGRWSETGAGGSGGGMSWKTGKGTEISLEGSTLKMGKGEEVEYEGYEPVKPYVAKAMQKRGMNPDDYVQIKHSNAVFEKGDTDRLDEALKRANTSRQKVKADFDANVPGYDDLKKEMSASQAHFEKERAAISRGSNLPASRESHVEELKQKYPAAAAYVKAEGFSESSNFQKAAAGRKAMEKIRKGESYAKVVDEMEKEWSSAAAKSAMNTEAAASAEGGGPLPPASYETAALAQAAAAERASATAPFLAELEALAANTSLDEAQFAAAVAALVARLPEFADAAKINERSAALLEEALARGVADQLEIETK